MIVDELIAILGFDLRGERDLARFERGLKGAETKAQNFSKSLIAIGGAATAAFAAIGGLSLIGDGISSITNTGAQFEGMTVQLKALEGSSQGAEKAMAWITDFAKKTPLELADVVDSYALMRTYGLDPMSGAMQSVTDAMAATGGGAEKLNGIITGLGQAWTKQKLQGEEIMQLLERGIPVWDMLSKATGKSVQELQKLSSAGKLGRKEIELLIDQIGEKYKGASEDYSKTWAGITSNLADNWTQFLKSIADAGYFEDAKRRLSGLLDWVNRAWENGTADLAAQRISDALVGAMNTASHLAVQAYRIGSAFYHAADGVVALTAKVTGLSKTWAAAGLGLAFIASKAGGRRLLMAVASKVPYLAAALVLDDLVSGLNGDKSVIGGLEGGKEALDRMNASFEDFAKGANQYAAGLNKIYGIDTKAGQTAMDAFMQFMAEDTVRSVNTLADMISDIAFAMGEIGKALENPEQAWQRFVDAAIVQIDRLLAAIDGKLGGALTKYGFISTGAQENPNKGKVQLSGRTERAPSKAPSQTIDASLYRDGSMNLEGLRVEYGVAEKEALSVAQRIGSILGSISGKDAIASAINGVNQFLEPGRQALAIQADLSKGVNATATLNIEQFMANAARAKAELQSLQSMSGRVSGAAGSGAIRTRPAVAESAAGP